MTTVAITMVKDEADIVSASIRHMLTQVDRVVALDNLSTDGSGRLMRQAGAEVIEDGEVGYYQSDKITFLARQMAREGHDWIVPFDADEIWYAPDGRPVKDWLAGIDRGIQFVQAEVYNHVATATDILHDMIGMPWRTRHHLPLAKVACRAREDLIIHQGNHSAETSATGLTGGGLEIRHFPIRSLEQFIRKVRNGAAAYAATNLAEDVGAHWRQWGRLSDMQLGDVFETYYWSEYPEHDSSLVYDPAPIGALA